MAKVGEVLAVAFAGCAIEGPLNGLSVCHTCAQGGGFLQGDVRGPASLGRLAVLDGGLEMEPAASRVPAGEAGRIR
jgi:hypothetical protein